MLKCLGILAMGIFNEIEGYLNNELGHIFSKYLEFDESNLKIYRDKFGSIVIDMIFPFEKHKEIDISEVLCAIDDLKQRFIKSRIEFNYFIEKTKTNAVIIPFYSIEILYSEKEECFIAIVPCFEYCFAKGDTREEALQKVERVLDDLVHHYVNEKIELPPPIQNYLQLEPDPKINK